MVTSDVRLIIYINKIKIAKLEGGSGGVIYYSYSIVLDTQILIIVE